MIKKNQILINLVCAVSSQLYLNPPTKLAFISFHRHNAFELIDVANVNTGDQLIQLEKTIFRVM